MQTPVYIPATTHRLGSRTTWIRDARCTIIAFVGISGVESNHELAGAFTAVHAIAMWDNGGLFERPVGDFSVLPEVDLTPPDIEIGEDVLARVAEGQAAMEAGKRRRRER